MMSLLLLEGVVVVVVVGGVGIVVVVPPVVFLEQANEPSVNATTNKHKGCFFIINKMFDWINEYFMFLILLRNTKIRQIGFYSL